MQPAVSGFSLLMHMMTGKPVRTGLYTYLEGRTGIYISHRMSSCRFCDDIIVFHEGEIVERGSHEELFDAGGRYTQMWNARARYYV